MKVTRSLLLLEKLLLLGTKPWMLWSPNFLNKKLIFWGPSDERSKDPIVFVQMILLIIILYVYIWPTAMMNIERHMSHPRVYKKRLVAILTKTGSEIWGFKCTISAHLQWWCCCPPRRLNWLTSTLGCTISTPGTTTGKNIFSFWHMPQIGPRGHQTLCFIIPFIIPS